MSMFGFARTVSHSQFDMSMSMTGGGPSVGSMQFIMYVRRRDSFYHGCQSCNQRSVCRDGHRHLSSEDRARARCGKDHQLSSKCLSRM
jgi:hypothetical protein